MSKWGMQALMLPEAVRLLHLLVTNGKRVYVHCTAGINRATLTTVGYLTFVKVCCCALQLPEFASLLVLAANIKGASDAHLNPEEHCKLARSMLCINHVASPFTCMVLLVQHSQSVSYTAMHHLM